MDQELDQSQNHEVIKKSEEGTEYSLLVHDDVRFTQWLKALKIRYWIDFGNQDQYKVGWVKNIDAQGELVELIIELHQHTDDGTIGSLIFMLTVDITKNGIVIQGEFQDLWKQNEFPKLQRFVSSLCANDLSEKGNIASLYSSVFDESSGSVLNLDRVSLDIFIDSDGEEDDQDPVILVNDDSVERIHSPKVNSPRRKIRKRSKKVPLSPTNSRLTKSPTGNARRNLKKASATDINLTKVLDGIQALSLRLDKLEDVVSKTDKCLAEGDLQLNILNENLQSTKEVLTSSLKGNLKHEFLVMKRDQEDVASETDRRVTKAEAEVKKWQGRVESLVEEKGNIEKRVRALELENSKLKDRITVLEQEDQSADQSKVQVDQEECVNLDDNNSINENVSGPNQKAKQEVTQYREYDYVMISDSNRKYIDKSKLCPRSEVTIIPCGNTEEATGLLRTPPFTVRQAIIINVGVNDVEQASVNEIVKRQVDMIHTARNSFPGIKLIISSITPRCDDLDKAVYSINAAVHQHIKGLSDVTHVDNSNLRSKHFFHDKKHLGRRTGVPVFARNLKNGIRQAFGKQILDRRPPPRVVQQQVTPSDNMMRPPPCMVQPVTPLDNMMRPPPRMVQQSVTPSDNMLSINSKLQGLMDMLVQQQQRMMASPFPSGLPLCNPQVSYNLMPNRAIQAVV